MAIDDTDVGKSGTGRLLLPVLKVEGSDIFVSDRQTIALNKQILLREWRNHCAFGGMDIRRSSQALRDAGWFSRTKFHKMVIIASMV
jgi:hypothetical protein